MLSLQVSLSLLVDAHQRTSLLLSIATPLPEVYDVHHLQYKPAFIFTSVSAIVVLQTKYGVYCICIVLVTPRVRVAVTIKDYVVPSVRRTLFILQICIDVMISRYIVMAVLRRRRGEIDGLRAS
jgi:hypothetical protein